ncbi:Zinc finger, C2H2 [Cordyceps fumosorosea ARSEF 2679]|uniref:Zinc finger, C2H2 n=1 Tax=Cordyceps fumosorosea (strain ARSEF 2679) TaxID=1081104 RepID=A0A167LEC4_CORFA|nr:Zinc finger, C2H2 [Cordyceps fumosorosea ARSEF 2679]OAA52986.1 Zinc finger, C2H2 [Cordyceps fumosorosea ARSEF 2679]
MEAWTHHSDTGPAPRATESPKPEAAFRKRFPETFRFAPSSLRRHSRAQSMCSTASVSSAPFFDSDTTYSASTVASPISTVHESEIEDHLLCPPSFDRPSSRVAERERRRHHFASFDSGSTWVGDREDEFDQDKLGKTMQSALTTSMSPKAILHESDKNDLESPVTAQHISDDDASMSGNAEGCEQDDTASPQTMSCGASSILSDEAPGSDADTLVTYTLQLVYGVDAPEQGPQISSLRRLSARYIRDLGEAVWQSPTEDGEQFSSQRNSCASNNSSPADHNARRSSQSGSSQSGSSKRKQDDSPDDGQGDGQGGAGFLPAKKARQSFRDDGHLRLSCPFRKRNPQRFNVRDHHSCAMTQHIVKQHKRDDPSAFLCDRCNRDFYSRKELRDHQRLPKELMCDLADHDPESGIDGPTCNKLLSRKRASGTSPVVQWREIWNLLFPDDDDHAIQPFLFIPVIEHFELASRFQASLAMLRLSLRDKISNQPTLDTICGQVHQCFAETVEQCLRTAQGLQYVNRSNKKGELSRTAQQQQAAARGGVGGSVASQHQQAITKFHPRPDSGIVLDDGSEETGSVTSSGIRCADGDAAGGWHILPHAGGSDQHGSGFVFGDGSSTPALSLQTPTSAFNPEILPTVPQLLPHGHHPVGSEPQTDFAHLWTDDMLYNMAAVPNVAQRYRRWDDTPSQTSFHESTTPNLF